MEVDSEDVTKLKGIHISSESLRDEIICRPRGVHRFLCDLTIRSVIFELLYVFYAQ